MSDSAWAGLFAAVPPTIVALGNLIVAIRAQYKLNHITMLTNSTLTAANQRIAQLEDQVIDLKRKGRP